MVYIGNIVKAHESLKEDKQLVLRYNHDLETTIYQDDKLFKSNGDLVIQRNGHDTVIFVDCEEVKCMIIGRRFL